MLDSPTSWKSGIWYHRVNVPCYGLMARGHGTKQVAIGHTIPEEFLDYPSTVVFGRIYNEALLEDFGVKYFGIGLTEK